MRGRPSPPDRVSGLLSRWVKGFRQRRAARHLSLVAAPGRALRVLDYGCGFGEALEHLSASVSYVGLDRNAEILHVARRRWPHAAFLLSETPAAISAAARFDAILLLAVLEHLSDPQALLAALAARLAPAGVLVVTTPHPIGEPLHHWGAALGLLSRMAGEEHEKLLGLDEIERLGAAAGLCPRARGSFLAGLNQIVVFARAGAA